MVLYIVSITAEIDNINKISLAPDANICLDIRNPSSDAEIREKVVINPRDYIQQEDNSREPPHHFEITWEGSRKKSTLTVLLDRSSIKSVLKKNSKNKAKVKAGSDRLIPRSLTKEDNQSFVPILALDCRGIEPYAFHPLGAEFIVESEGGLMFEDVDMSEADWCDYDGENDIPVSISDFKSTIENI